MVSSVLIPQNFQELENMKKRLKEIEEEASALREMQGKVEKEMGIAQGVLIIFVFVFKDFQY